MARCWLWLPILVASAQVCAASIISPRRPAPTASATYLTDAPRFAAPALHHSEREALLRASRQAGCAASQPAEALTTPDPLLDAADSLTKVAVSFIIGTDGRVHSPVILESAGPFEDHSVLDAVLAWRYRPAMCNAAPTETESKVEFSSQ